DSAAVQLIGYANRAIHSLAGRLLLPSWIRLLCPRIPEDMMAALAGILYPAADLQQRCSILRLDGTHRFEAKSLQGSRKSVKAPAVPLDERGDLRWLQFNPRRVRFASRRSCFAPRHHQQVASFDDADGGAPNVEPFLLCLRKGVVHTVLIHHGS